MILPLERNELMNRGNASASAVDMRRRVLVYAHRHRATTLDTGESDTRAVG